LTSDGGLAAAAALMPKTGGPHSADLLLKQSKVMGDPLMENGTFVAVLLIWIAFFILAIPLIRRIRHPDQRPFAAYLIFVSLFTLVAGILFALLFLLLVFVPALLVATWQARKPRWWKAPPA
jgi:hypothetical protein